MKKEIKKGRWYINAWGNLVLLDIDNNVYEEIVDYRKK